ncbi:phospho-N-acetylmuramoyl-pentapeptide-transferase [bacterium]|nr:phospho-N-acetylmuramoyl-pentapeptide-transferase [bacterium]
MFYELLKYLFPQLALETPLQVFGYITVRAGCALGFAFIVSLLLGPLTIRRLKALKLGQQVRQFKTAETAQFNIHQHKAGTPTMGGILIIVATLSAALLFCRLDNSYVWLVSGIMLVTGALGFADDFKKIARHNHKGVSAKGKLAVQILVGCALGAFLYFTDSHTSYAIVTTEGGETVSRTVAGDTHLLAPFFKTIYPSMGLFFIIWAAFVLTATSNAVNLTDGLDGLAIGATITVSLPYLVIAYLVSRFDYAGYLFVAHVPQTGELAVFLSALIGAGMGFLWFNAHPAQMFMGDTGSLSLGAVIGTIALLCKHEILLVLIGGIFVIEALSVVVQVASYKTRGKRVLLMSPLHNHFVKMGIHESKIIARFTIVATLLALAGLSTLKLR